MPKGSLIIGVDLNPIKPLPHVTTFVSDITTPQCRAELRKHMHDWKADLVMHDGAPNVGSAWVQDAFTQNELVLQSLRLATEFLCKDGNFVTKVFRSQDYNSLMWVFGQLFKSVEATKPPSSRNVSAEIFVVCQGFLAPKHIDPKFLDPKHVFKDLASLPTSITDAPADGDSTIPPSASAAISANPHSHSNVFMPEKKRRNRDGYADGDYTLFHKATASQFVRGADPVSLLGTMNQISFETEEEKAWLKSRHTTPDVVANFADLKVLGKGDFKALMKWRLALRLELGLDVKADKTADETEEVVVEEMDEEEQISAELKRLQEQKAIKARRERKKNNEKKARDLLKLQLNMTAPEDLDMADNALGGEEEMFDLGEAEREAVRQGRSSTLHNAMADVDGLSDDESSTVEEAEEEEEVLDSDEEREAKLGDLEGQLDGLYDEYKERMSERDAKWKVKQARAKDRNYDSWTGIKEGSDSEDDGVDKGHKDGLRGLRMPRRGDADEDDGEVSEDGGWDIVAANKARLGEEPDSSDESDDEEERPIKKAKVSKEKVKVSKPAPAASVPKGLVTSLNDKEARAQMSRQAQVWFDQSVFKGLGDLAALDGDDEEEEEDEDDDEEDGEDEDETMDEDEGDEEEEEQQGSDVDMGSEDEDDFEIVPQNVDDGPSWDVDDEDQDEVKQKLIKGECPCPATLRFANNQTRVFSPLRLSRSLPSWSTGKQPQTSSSTTDSTVCPHTTRTVCHHGSWTTSPSSTSPTSPSPKKPSTLFVSASAHWTPGQSRRSPRRRLARSSRRPSELRRPSARPTV